MSEIKFITNILKVADIDSEYLCEPIIKFLAGFIYYQDTILEEHIYSVADAIESNHFHKLTSLDQWTLKKVLELTGKEDCAYIRVVYNSNKAVQDQEQKRLRSNLKASGLSIKLSDGSDLGL